MFPKFTDDQTAVRDAARDFALAEIAPGAAARDASGEFPKDIFQQLGEMGFLGMTVPEAYGGAGVDFMSYILALEQVAYADASVAVAMSVNNSVACAPILAFGTEVAETDLPEAPGQRGGAGRLHAHGTRCRLRRIGPQDPRHQGGRRLAS